MNAKTRITSALASVQTLRRNRLLLIAGVLTVLPAAALAPSLLGPAKSPALLVAVDQITTSSVIDATIHEGVVERASATFSSPLVIDRADPLRPAFLPVAPAPMALEIKPNATPLAANDRMFNGRAVRPVRKMAMLVTAYSPDELSCGESADGITASGYSVWTNAMKMVAADTDVLPFGTLISLPGYDEANIVPVLDRGGAIKGNRLDVLYPTHEQALKWGVQRLEVTVWEYVDGQPADFQVASR